MNNTQKIHVAIIDENELFREGVERILLPIDRFKVVFEGSDVDELLQAVLHTPDIILLDQLAFENTSIKQMKQLREGYPRVKLGLFMTDVYSHNVSKAVELNVLGYLTKNMEVSVFSEALQKIYKNQHWVDAHMTDLLLSAYKCLISQLTNNPEQTLNRPLHLLTNREAEVLQYLANGYQNQDIANAMNVSQSTVKNHVTHILIKLKVHDRTQAVIKAIQHNWVEID